MGSQSQVLLDQLDTLPCRLRDRHTVNSHGMGMQDCAFLPGTKMQCPSVDNSQYPQRTRQSGWLLKELLALDDPALGGSSKVMALCNLPFVPRRGQPTATPNSAED